jgi:hypothetical protein
MHNGSSTTRGIAWLALFLFVGGLLCPFVLFVALTALAKMSPDSATGIAMGFGAISELLGLVLGIIGWRHTAGKVATIGVGLLVALALVGMLSWVMR